MTAGYLGVHSELNPAAAKRNQFPSEPTDSLSESKLQAHHVLIPSCLLQLEDHTSATFGSVSCLRSLLPAESPTTAALRADTALAEGAGPDDLPRSLPAPDILRLSDTVPQQELHCLQAHPLEGIISNKDEVVLMRASSGLLTPGTSFLAHSQGRQGAEMIAQDLPNGHPKCLDSVPRR